LVAQWLRFSGGNFLRVIGIGRKDDWDALFTRFRALRDGIEFR
jgi:cell division inhibitor SulA